MQMNSKKVKKFILANLPYLIFGYAGDKIGYAYRISEGNDISAKLLPFMNNIGISFAQIIPSLNSVALLVGVALAVIMKIIMYIKSKNKKKFRQGEEYGSAVWGTASDIEPYMDSSDKDNTVILTQTEYLTMVKPSSPKFVWNKNIMIIGGS